MSALTVVGVAKAFGSTPVLTDVTLSVPSGGFAAVLGPSGSGKTTLLRLLAGFDAPDRGRIALDGETLDDEQHRVPAHRRRIGYVPQEGLLFPHLTVAENIGLGLPRRSRGGSRVTDLLELIGLGGLGHRRPHELSGGQQQRVAVARALAPEPRLILLDEPFAALDASLRESLRAEIKQLLASLGTTVVLVTHDQEEALSLADIVAILERRPHRPARIATGHLPGTGDARGRPLPRRHQSRLRALRRRHGIHAPRRAAGRAVLAGRRGRARPDPARADPARRPC